MREIVGVRTAPLPMVLRFTDVRSYLFTSVFVALSVLTPWIFHQFHLAGATFLPMHIFVLVAGLLFGWRAGLAVGLLTPLVSFAASGMPVLRILPQIAIELAAYGAIAGLLREKLSLSPVWSLLGAMAGGRLALALAATVTMVILGESYSPLGAAANPFMAVWAAVRQGFPGIIVQLALVPVIVLLCGRFLRGAREG